MSGSIYPNVPNVPGVPALLRLASANIPPSILATADVLGLQSFINAVQWGIFDQGGSVVLAVDTVIDFAIARDFAISDYSVEGSTLADGAAGFFSYNKVARPFQSKLRVAVGGNDTARATFFAALDKIVADLNLYNVVSPEYVWYNANVTHYDVHRSRERGTTLVQADIWLEEVRVLASAKFSKSQGVNGADPASGGPVQPQDVTSAQLPAIRDANVQ